MSRRMPLLPCALLCAVLALACFPAMPSDAWAAEVARATGKVVAQVTRVATMPFNGIVDEVLVRPGQAVEAGDALLRYHLQDEDERRLRQELITGANTEGFRGSMLQLESQLAEIMAQRNKARQLAAGGLGSHQAAARLEHDVASIQKRIDLLRVNIRKAEETFHNRLKELEGHFGSPLRENGPLPESLVLVAPISGHVLTMAPGVSEGGMLSRGQAAASVGRLDPVIVEVPVYEGEVTGISVGDTAEVSIASLNDRKFTAKVSEISWAATDMNVANPSYYTVELRVPNPKLELKPGFKAVVRFATGGASR